MPASILSRFILPGLFACAAANSFGNELTGSVLAIDESLHHIRNGAEREWASFPADASETSYEKSFVATANDSEWLLRATQEDVKQNWDISLNGTPLGRLHRDENSIVGFWPIPSATLIDGQNVLSIRTRSKAPDDIRVGKIAIMKSEMVAALKAATLVVTVRDAATDRVTPCRVTILRDDSLMTCGASSTDEMAVRPGVVYCKGIARFGVPAGEYRIIAGRGPEYSMASQTVTVTNHDHREIELSIRREVLTEGFVACDTHVHTLTHSGHGDCSMRERMLTLAGEAVEFPIATDHNTHIAYDELATELNVSSFFTPVIGNEVTTKIGHFNVFPVLSMDTPIPNHKAEHWDGIFKSIHATPEVQVAILNHARDIHSSFRPFGPEHHIAATAENLDGWNLQANAMEIINSGAQQTDMMRLVHDWMGQLNAGRQMTPVGSSDSHDVARYIVGQGRTYIRCDDSDPGMIDMAEAVEAFVAGKVTVSCGLMADIRVNQTFRVGDLVSQTDHYVAAIDVMGPSWINADQVEVFVNGRSIAVRKLPAKNRAQPGLKATFKVELPISEKQDAFVVAVVTGPGVTGLHWPLAKPYQPTSPNWKPQSMAITGAIWVDGDGDGERTSAKKYAARLCQAAQNQPHAIIDRLKEYDAAVALHAAAQLRATDEDVFAAAAVEKSFAAANVHRAVFQEYLESWRESQRARVGSANE